MESIKELFNKYGRTRQSTSFGREIIQTIDPVNIQSVMAQDFDSWGLAPLRYPAAALFMGRGVFTSDGPFWQRTRAQVRPVLTKAQFTDYGRLEYHLQNFGDHVIASIRQNRAGHSSPLGRCHLLRGAANRP